MIQQEPLPKRSKRVIVYRDDRDFVPTDSASTGTGTTRQIKMGLTAFAKANIRNHLSNQSQEPLKHRVSSSALTSRSSTVSSAHSLPSTESTMMVPTSTATTAAPHISPPLTTNDITLTATNAFSAIPIHTSTPASSSRIKQFNFNFADLNAAIPDIMALESPTRSNLTVNDASLDSETSMERSIVIPTLRQPDPDYVRTSRADKPTAKLKITRRPLRQKDDLLDKDLANLLDQSMAISNNDDLINPTRALQTEIIWHTDTEPTDLDEGEQDDADDDATQGKNHHKGKQVRSKGNRSLRSSTRSASSASPQLQSGSSRLKTKKKISLLYRSKSVRGDTKIDDMVVDQDPATSSTHRRKTKSSLSTKAKEETLYGSGSANMPVNKRTVPMRGTKGSLIRDTPVKVNDTASADEIGI